MSQTEQDTSNAPVHFISEVKITQTEVFIDKFKIPSVKSLHYQDGSGASPGLLTLTVYLPLTEIDVNLASRVEMHVLSPYDSDILNSERQRCADIVSDLLARLNDTEYHDTILSALREIEQGEYRK